MIRALATYKFVCDGTVKLAFCASTTNMGITLEIICISNAHSSILLYKSHSPSTDRGRPRPIRQCAELFGFGERGE